MNKLPVFDNPVYRAQCKTWAFALKVLLGKELTKDQGLATPGNHPIAHFRAIQKYRSLETQAMRVFVARAYRSARRQS